MSATAGTDPQILSLPKGGGAVADLGTTFETDLNTGTGSYGLSLPLPAGPNGIVPKIDLRYHSAAGNGPLGIGWTLGALSVARKTDGRTPTYDDHDDRFLIPGVEDLVDMGSQGYRLRVDSLCYRILRTATGWEVTDTRGTVHRLGGSAASRIEDGSLGFARTAAWLLDSSTDSGGDAIRYQYLADGAQRYVERIEWGTYALVFRYEARPDTLSSCVTGFLVPTGLRCAVIELHVTTIAPTLARSWTLEYEAATGSGISLLTRITQRGHAADGSTLASPAVTLGYTKPQARSLRRMQGPSSGMGPKGLADGRGELVDWDGDGLPDVFELRNGRARLWRNRGYGRWAYPLDFARFPGPSDLNRPGLIFADMDGNGSADLANVGTAMAGYYPRRQDGGFDRPVRFAQAPSARLAGGEGRFVDLDGNGVPDVLFTDDEFYALYLRDGTGYADRPQVIPRKEAPPVDLRDAHVRLADMNGDGVQDLVRVDGAGVTYWPYLGNGTWAGAVELANPPRLPRGYDPRRMFLADIDGDGCADFVYVDRASVFFWYNLGGAALSEAQVIPFAPTGSVADVRVVDLMGTGTCGVLWSNVPDGVTERGYVFLDLMGGTKPYLLNRIDNGLGLISEINYRPSTHFAVDAADAGNPWRTFHPFPIQCVASLRITDQTTAVSSLTEYAYHEARYDGARRAFLGFAVVDTITHGDATVPMLRTRNTYHLGVDPADPARPLTADEVEQFGALRRRLLRTELYGLDGSADEARPYRTVQHDYATRVVVAPNGNHVVVPFETRTTEDDYERAASPFSSRTIDYLAFDDFGNISRQRMRTQRSETAAPDQDISSETTFAQNLAAHIISLPARVTQRDAGGAIISQTVTYYDGPPHVGLPEGSATAGHVSRVDVLAIADADAAAVYGGALPDFASLGYHRHAGESGWWITRVSYERIGGASPTGLITRNPRGGETRVDYDPHRQYPLRVTDARGHVYVAGIDERTLQMSSLTDANGQTTTDIFDALGRVASTVGPLDSTAQPSTAFAYDTASFPLKLVSRTRTAHGGTVTHDTVEYFDGQGSMIQRISPGEGDAGRAFIVQHAPTVNARGSVAVKRLPFYVASAAYAPPPAATPEIRYTYDALGRSLTETRANGIVRTWTHAPGISTLNEQFATAPAGRSVTQHMDGLGRILAMERMIEGRTVRNTYVYDALNRLVESTDPDGGTTRLTYDLLGRLLRDVHPDTGTTVTVFDAGGNQIERRLPSGRSVLHTIDALERVTSVKPSDAAAAEVIYHYLDPGDPLPPDGVRFRKGRLWKIEDSVGTLTYTYNERGVIVEQRRQVTALGREFVTSSQFDAVGRMTRVTLPERQVGEGRRVIDYVYNDRGLPVAAPGYVKSCDYDVFGRMTRQVLQNGTENVFQFEPFSGRPVAMLVPGPGGTLLREQHFTYDDFGNLAAIDGAIPEENGKFGYDEADRLIKATYGNGDVFGYAYSDGGNITHVDGLGTLGTARVGSGAVISAGPDAYTYDPDGNMRTSPRGTYDFDAQGRLVRVAATGGGTVTYDYDFKGTRAVRHAADGGLTVTADPNIEIVNGKAVLWIPFAGGRVAGIAEGQAAFFIHSDAFGTASLFTDALGAVLRRVTFGPYGSVRTQSGITGGPPYDTSFGNGELDADVGLISLGRRHYDPRIGRFISPDILVAGVFSLDGWNRYCYARCNPLRYRDPSGALSVGDVFAIIAIVVVIAVLVVAAVLTCGGTAAPSLPFIAGLSVSLSGILAATAVGVAGGAIIGGIAAARAGGDIWKGVLFGGFVGGVSAFAGAYLGGGVLGLMGGSPTDLLGAAVAGGTQGSFAGAGTGAAIGFAGGKGSSESVWRHVLLGAVIGLATGAALGAFFSNFNSNSALKLGTLDKFSISQATKQGAKGAVGWLDNSGSSIQDLANWIGEGPNASGFTEFLDIGEDSSQTLQFFSNSSICSIPMGWVPSATFNYGGLIGIEDVSFGLDAFGVKSWDAQVLLLLNAVPFVGIILGYGIGEGSDWETKGQAWVHNHASFQSLD